MKHCKPWPELMAAISWRTKTREMTMQNTMSSRSPLGPGGLECISALHKNIQLWLKWMFVCHYIISCWHHAWGSMLMIRWGLGKVMLKHSTSSLQQWKFREIQHGDVGHRSPVQHKFKRKRKHAQQSIYAAFTYAHTYLGTQLHSLSYAYTQLRKQLSYPQPYTHTNHARPPMHIHI